MQFPESFSVSFLYFQRQFIVGEEHSTKTDRLLENTLSANVSIWYLASLFSILISAIVVRSHIGTQLAVLTPLCYHFTNGFRILCFDEDAVNSMGKIHIVLGIVCLIIYNKN